MPKKPSQVPRQKSQECARLEKSLIDIVSQARILFQKIDEAEMFIHECQLLEHEEGENPFPTLQAEKDWLKIARPQFQLLREQFHYLLTQLPDDLRKKVSAKLNLKEVSKLFGEEGEEMAMAEEAV